MKHPMQKIEIDSECVARFRENAIVRYLLESHPTADMNTLACVPFSRADREQFAMLIGYSVSGFGELDYASKKMLDKADAKVDALLRAQTAALDQAAIDMANDK